MSAEFILGKCCGCGIEGDAVRNIVALHYVAPERGKGWGCFQCGLPRDGASVVLCDECLKAQRYETVVVGYAGENNRTPYDEFMKTAQPFNHDMSKHPEPTQQAAIDFVELDDDEPLVGWKCPHCGYIPEGMMDVVDIHEGQAEGSVCPACKALVPTEDWIILSEDQMFDEWGFGGMDERDFEDIDESEDYDDFIDEDGFDRMGSDYADYDEPDDSDYPGADAAEMWGDE